MVSLPQGEHKEQEKDKTVRQQKHKTEEAQKHDNMKLEKHQKPGTTKHDAQNIPNTLVTRHKGDTDCKHQ